MKLIKLTRERFAKVDDHDFEWLNQWKWCAYGNRYAARAPGARGKQKLILMHRLIIGTPLGMYTDHINGDGFDNRRENLRVCTKSENAKNSRLSARNTSGYKGVSRNREQWLATIRVNYKLINLGRYDTPLEAARAYNKAAVMYHGQFARLNEV